MIKYTNVPGFINAGEVGFGTHLYQFVESEVPEGMLRLIILVRAYDQKSTCWVGYVTNNDMKIRNQPQRLNLMNVKDVEGLVGKLELVNSFGDFIKGNSMENYFKDFEEVK